MSTRFAYRISLALLILLTTGPMAQAINWNGSIDTDWFNAGNWSGAFPTASTSDIGPGVGPGFFNPTISAAGATSGHVEVGYVGGSGVLNITGGTLTIGGVLDMTVQDATAGTNTGTVNHTGGTVTLPDALYIGRSAAGFGLYTLDGGTLSMAGLATSDLEIEHTGTFDWLSGTLTGVGDLFVGNTAAGSAVVNLHGKTLTTVNDVWLSYLAVGRTGTDAINLQGGSLIVGSLPRGTGNNVNDDFYIGGNTGAGTTFTIGAGETVDIGDNFYMGDNLGGKPILNLNAGSTLSIGGDWLIARHQDDTVSDIVNINDASGFVMTKVEGPGNVVMEGESTFNMNDTVNTLFLPTAFNVGTQNTGVAILNMAADTTIDVGTSMTIGTSNVLGDTYVDQINMGAGSLLTLGTTFNVSGWDGGGTITHAAGTIDAGGAINFGAGTVAGMAVTLDMTGGTMRSGATFTLAGGAQPGGIDIDYLNQSGGLIDASAFTITHNGRADISGDATLDTTLDLNIGSGAEATAVSRFTARGNSTINIGDDVNFGTQSIHGENTFTIKGNADVNVGFGSGIGDINLQYLGTINIKNGTLDIADRFNIGTSNNVNAGQRIVNQSGGDVVVGGYMDLATGNGIVNGVYNLTGGTLQIGTLATDELDLTSTSTGTVEFNLDGGILNVTRIDDGTGNGLFNFGAGTLSPGFKDNAALTAYIGDLVMSSDSKLTMDILTADIAGLPNDLLTVSGNLTFDGKIKLNELNGLGTGIPGRYIIATYGGVLVVGAPVLVNAGFGSTFDYLTPGEIAVLFAPPAVPEPSTGMLLGLGLFGLLRRSRRRQK